MINKLKQDPAVAAPETSAKDIKAELEKSKYAKALASKKKLPLPSVAVDIINQKF